MTEQPAITHTRPEHWRKRRHRRPDGAGSENWPYRVSFLRLDRQRMQRCACRSYAEALRKAANALKALNKDTGALHWTRAIVDQWREGELNWYRLALIDAPRPCHEQYIPPDPVAVLETRKAAALAARHALADVL